MEHTEFCTKCGKHTIWKGDDKRHKCQGCNGVFPCYHDCKHEDCLLQKGKRKLCGCGMILRPDKECTRCKKGANE